MPVVVLEVVGQAELILSVVFYETGTVYADGCQSFPALVRLLHHPGAAMGAPYLAAGADRCFHHLSLGASVD